jgi:uncharacterized membrane protein YbhN (UPF0104 family)
MPKLLKTIIKFVCFLAIGLGLLWLVTHNMSDEEKQNVITAFKHANYWLIIPVMVVGVASHWYRAVRWKLLMATFGYKPTTLNTFFAVMVGYLVNLAIPRLGEVTRCGIVARYEKVPADKLVGTMIAERAVDLLLLILIMIATVLVQIDLVSALFTEQVLIPVQEKVGAIDNTKAWLLLAAVIIFIGLIFLGIRLLARSKFGLAIKNMARGVWVGFLSIGKMEKKGWFIFYSILIWGLYFAMMYLGFMCMDETKNLGLKAALSVLAFGSVGMIVTPGGTGAYQAIVQKTLVLYGVAEPIGFAFGTIVWAAQTLLVMILGFGSLIALPIYNKNPASAPDKG